MKRTKKAGQRNLDSPESLVTPYEDINTIQHQLTGETFPTLALGICDSCMWCYSCINTKGLVKICPLCNGIVSQIPMAIDEVCVIEKDENRGITLEFSRRLPLR